MGKRVIAFSLWGDVPMYNVGAIRNAELISEVYPGWVARFYIGSDVPQKTTDALKGLGVEIVDMSGTPNDWQGMFWRFYGIDKEEDIEYLIFRDTDSRLSSREYEAVTEWVNSGKILHIMRDHPYHSEPIMGGMWGCKPKELIDIVNENVYRKYEMPEVNNVKQIIENWLLVEIGRTERQENNCLLPENYRTKGIDQRFLRALVYPLALKNAHIQDAYPMYNGWSARFDINRAGAGFDMWGKEVNTGFPSMRGKDWNNFIGQVYDENDIPNEDYARFIRERDEMIYKDWG